LFLVNFIFVRLTFSINAEVAKSGQRRKTQAI
jgi:hypothetical protein